jgi:hypothetical protein
MTLQSGSPSSSGQEDQTELASAADRLRCAVIEACRNGGSRDDLEPAALHLVKTLKSTKQPPERILLRVKQILADAGLRPSYALPSDPGTTTRMEAAVYRDVIAWSIRQYYEDATSG